MRGRQCAQRYDQMLSRRWGVREQVASDAKGRASSRTVHPAATERGAMPTVPMVVPVGSAQTKPRRTAAAQVEQATTRREAALTEREAALAVREAALKVEQAKLVQAREQLAKASQLLGNGGR